MRTSECSLPRHHKEGDLDCLWLGSDHSSSTSTTVVLRNKTDEHGSVSSGSSTTTVEDKMESVQQQHGPGLLESLGRMMSWRASSSSNLGTHEPKKCGCGSEMEPEKCSCRKLRRTTSSSSAYCGKRNSITETTGTQRWSVTFSELSAEPRAHGHRKMGRRLSQSDTSTSPELQTQRTARFMLTKQKQHGFVPANIHTSKKMGRRMSQSVTTTELQAQTGGYTYDHHKALERESNHPLEESPIITGSDRRTCHRTASEKNVKPLEPETTAQRTFTLDRAVSEFALRISLKQNYVDEDARPPPKQRGVRRRTSMLVSHSSPEEKNALGITNASFCEPVSLVALMAAGRATPQATVTPKSCLSKNSKHTSSKPASKNEDTMMKKSVRFTVDSDSGKIWCLESSFDKIPLSLKDQIWWSEKETDDRFEQDVGMARLVEPLYRRVLHDAYRSSKEPDATPESILLHFSDMSPCAIARGLESQVFPEIIDRKEDHCQLVLDAQARNASPSFIRHEALMHSRESELVAAKMAHYDMCVAWGHEGPKPRTVMK